jgi:homoserine kinase type II
MSVFTSVTLPQLQTWLHDYAIGEVTELKGISSGITNTNYFVTTTQDRFVLTLFEHNTLEELPYYIDLMTHLAAHDIPCPKPIADKRGVSLHMLNGKPATLITCLQGRDIETPNIAQCAEVGSVLARMHLAGLSFDHADHHDSYHNPRGALWRNKTSLEIMPHLSAEDQTLLQTEMAFQEELDVSALPTGVIHADLFRDNVLFVDDHVGGLIDFYYACHDVLAYDLAITVNDWCVNKDGSLDEARVTAMFQAYQAIRPFNEAELKHWPHMLRIAALRFWLSRLYDQIFPQAGELTHAKDPNHFKNILKLRAKQL